MLKKFYFEFLILSGFYIFAILKNFANKSIAFKVCIFIVSLLLGF